MSIWVREGVRSTKQYRLTKNKSIDDQNITRQLPWGITERKNILVCTRTHIRRTAYAIHSTQKYELDSTMRFELEGTYANSHRLATFTKHVALRILTVLLAIIQIAIGIAYHTYLIVECTAVGEGGEASSASRHAVTHPSLLCNVCTS